MGTTFALTTLGSIGSMTGGALGGLSTQVAKYSGILFGLMTGKVDSTNQALMIMLGSLGTAWVSIISFYFGSSSGSQKKDQMIYNSTPSK